MCDANSVYIVAGNLLGVNNELRPLAKFSPLFQPDTFLFIYVFCIYFIFHDLYHVLLLHTYRDAFDGNLPQYGNEKALGIHVPINKQHWRVKV